MDRTRAAGGVLAAGSAAFVLAVLVASQAPGPRTWALHLPGFLPGPERALVMTLLVLGVVLLLLDFIRGRAARPQPSRRSTSRSVPFRLPRWSGWLLLLPGAWVLLKLGTRTRFLGDGQIWLDSVLAGRPNGYSEPLASATWILFSRILTALGYPVDQTTVAFLPVLCGVLAAALLWGIAGEITPKTAPRAVAFVTLITLGVAQLYFGYIESYSTVSVAILLYLWLGLRHARGADRPIWIAIALAVAIASHLACLYLVPSFLVLVLRERRPWRERVGLASVSAALALALLLLLGCSPSRWVEAFQLASRSAQSGHGASVFAKPYGVFSLEHAWDVLNAILLALPIPALLILSAVVADRSRGRIGPTSTFLLVAAIPGLCLAAALILPVAPAQDWDLFSILLLPLAVFGVNVGLSRIPVRGARGMGLVSLGVGSLLAFVLVNSNEASSVRRYETLIGPDAKVTAFARAYGNELLGTYDELRNDQEEALRHADRAIDAEPTNPRYWIKRGVALDRMGRSEEALPALQNAVRLGPTRDDGYYYLGNCFYSVRRFPEAAASYREAIRRSGPRPDYLYSLGVALYYSGMKDSTRAIWTDVARRWPSYTAASRSLTSAFGNGGLDSAFAPWPG